MCSQLIKQYATQKLYTPTITSSEFKGRLQDYLQGTNAIQNIFLNQILTKVRAGLPNQQQLPEKKIESVIDGQQSKVENYEVFKALNDKWIAGGDFTNKTLFEDFLFLDRASRNVGDIILVDIFDLKNTLKESSINMEMSVFTFLSGILIKNKFNVMPLPAYVNFYNVQDADGTTISQSAEGSLEFADNMWGTFLDVDYRKSGPKLICFYAGLPSAYLDLPKGNSRFRDDAFDLKRANNPLIENQVGKKDWALSNKCVGFNVDIGTRNQNIFYSFNVSMDSGKATSETIQTQLNMVNQANGKTVATQNNGLYNLYKQRSYQCQVVCLGNALLQPTMYFNLRHVPMFNGPYLITDVTHTIGSGEFQTSFTGVRQGVFDLPSIDNFLQSINQNLLTQIESIILTNKDNVPDKPLTNIDKTALLSQNGDNVAAAANSCTNNLSDNYVTWGDFVESITTGLSPLEFANAITAKVTDTELQTTIYMLCYILTFNKDKFYGYNNNFANVPLSTNWGASTIYFVQKQSSCVKIPNSLGALVSQPIANFTNLDKFLDFMVARLTPNLKRIYYGENGNAPLGLLKYYVCYWKPPTAENQNIPESYFDENQDEFTKLYDTFDDAYESAKVVQLDFESVKKAYDAVKLQIQKIATSTLDNIQLAINNLNTTTLPLPTCFPPTITSFSPLTGVTGTILNITGTDLGTVTAVTINNVTTTTGITINSGINILVFIPFSNTPIPQDNTITLSGVHGIGTSTTTFTYNPQQVSAAPPTVAPTIPPNSNTNPQQTGPITMISSYNSDPTGSNVTITVVINPELIPGVAENVSGAISNAQWLYLNSQVYTKMAYQCVKMSATTNNQQTQVILLEGSFNNLPFEGNFINEWKFVLSTEDILDVFDNKNITIPSGTQKILCQLQLSASKFQDPNKYQRATQSFPITILL